MKLINICGARPNFMKIAPLMHAFEASELIDPLLVHTGQHYDERMDGCFFADLGIAPPAVNLEVGSASHAVQTARIMERFEPIVKEHQPAAVLVVGDVNSTVACALVSVKMHIPVFHVEAGLRSFDRSMPEEINRIVTDALSDLLFVTERSGLENLKREGVPAEKIRFSGNVMIDTLLRFRDRAAESKILEQLGLTERGYGVATLHRPSNVDDHAVLDGILDAIEHVNGTMPVVFPMHPRTRANIKDTEIGRRIDAMDGLRLLEPVGYLDFLRLMSASACVLTDSGGIQEETTILGVPCLTLRENTERPVTISEGTNRLVGTDPAKIIGAFNEIKGQPINPRQPELWDGRAAVRIAREIEQWHRAESSKPSPELMSAGR